MADHLTEEEQIEALKNWWKDYGKSLAVLVAAAGIGYFGFTTWEKQKEVRAAEGGVKYDALVEVLGAQPGVEVSDEDKATAQILATEITKDYEGSLYADHANLILARLAVDEKDLAGAEALIQRVVDGGANTSIKELAKGRLARVLVAKGDFDKALSLVSSKTEEGYKSLFAEVRGDALVGKGSVESAKTAYQEALDGLAPEQFNHRSILQLKIDGVGLLVNRGSAPVQNEAAPEETTSDATPDANTGEAATADAENS